MQVKMQNGRGATLYCLKEGFGDRIISMYMAIKMLVNS